LHHKEAPLSCLRFDSTLIITTSISFIFTIEPLIHFILFFYIVMQIENEYNSVQLAYKNLGVSYIQWAGNMALGLNTGVPWVMCKQKDAPGPVVS